MTDTALQDLADSFTLFDDWEARYRYLIDLGKRLPPMDQSLKTDERLVKGCTSRVWLEADVRTDDQGRRIFHFTADSDAQIVRGLIYILILAYQDKPVDKIPDIDIEAAFEDLGLANHLSPNRRNGFFAMVERIRALGRACAT